MLPFLIIFYLHSESWMDCKQTQQFLRHGKHITFEGLPHSCKTILSGTAATSLSGTAAVFPAADRQCYVHEGWAKRDQSCSIMNMFVMNTNNVFIIEHIIRYRMVRSRGSSEVTPEMFGAIHFVDESWSKESSPVLMFAAGEESDDSQSWACDSESNQAKKKVCAML